MRTSMLTIRCDAPGCQRSTRWTLDEHPANYRPHDWYGAPNGYEYCPDHKANAERDRERVG